MDTKPFHAMSAIELINMSSALLEHQIQEEANPGLVANKLQQLASGLFSAEADLRQARGEYAHREEWWKTYRCALTGLLAGGKMTVEECHKYSEQAADRAHGALEKISAE